jgi:hypothetical protein
VPVGGALNLDVTPLHHLVPQIASGLAVECSLSFPGL